jgi:hypothetical protein
MKITDGGGIKDEPHTVISLTDLSEDRAARWAAFQRNEQIKHERRRQENREEAAKRDAELQKIIKEKEESKAAIQKIIEANVYRKFRFLQEYYFPGVKTPKFMAYEREPAYKESIPVVDVAENLLTPTDPAFKAIMLMTPRILFLLGRSVRSLVNYDDGLPRVYPMLMSFSERNLTTPLKQEISQVEDEITKLWKTAAT